LRNIEGDFSEWTQHLKSRRQGLEDEYDIVLYNHTSVAIIEVKYKAHTKDIPIVLKKAETFRILFPEYNECFSSEKSGDFAEQRNYFAFVIASFDCSNREGLRIGLCVCLTLRVGWSKFFLTESLKTGGIIVLLQPVFYAHYT